MSQVPSLTMNDGHTIPQLGFGTYQIPPEDTARAVGAALDVGYRHIDTAQMYGNERGVGEAVRASGVKREDVFVTSKLNNGNHLPDDARASFDATLERLGLDYVDLFLIHWPLPTLYDGDFISTWRVMEAFRDSGRARSIGVSNFEPEHLDRLAAETGTTPAVNQVEAHPYFQNARVRAYDREHGILTEAWAPIAKARVLDEAAIVEVARAVGRTPAQVVLRWHVQRGDVVFPKSVSPERMAENFALFDFELDDASMRALDGLDRGEEGRIGMHPDEMNIIPKD
ncbi:MAG: aldo/keto reductase [Trueperaceae bacterium]|nr:aldo/keto reductase [Trueperaceae bacterium]